MFLLNAVAWNIYKLEIKDCPSRIRFVKKLIYMFIFCLVQLQNFHISELYKPVKVKFYTSKRKHFLINTLMLINGTPVNFFDNVRTVD